MKKFIITGFYSFEERENKNQMHGILVVEGDENMKIVEVKEEEVINKITKEI